MARNYHNRKKALVAPVVVVLPCVDCQGVAMEGWVVCFPCCRGRAQKLDVLYPYGIPSCREGVEALTRRISSKMGENEEHGA